MSSKPIATVQPGTKELNKDGSGKRFKVCTPFPLHQITLARRLILKNSNSSVGLRRGLHG
jgi:hypothetical protein